MEKRKIPTSFAPADRAEVELVREQFSRFEENPLFVRMLDVISTAVLIINRNRQIVFANRAFMEMIRISDPKAIAGLRPGEVLGCIFSGRTEGGCGTTEFCRECGAARAILSSLDGKEDVQECRISLEDDPNALDLRVSTSPVELMGDTFSVFSITDIGNEKRREVLERIFLHDLKNTAGGLRGFSSLITDVEEQELETHKNTILDLTDKLLDEIDSYSQLVSAENKRLQVRPVTFVTTRLLERIRNLYISHHVAGGKHVQIDPGAGEVKMTTDETILFRVIGNMTKNALEAVGPGQSVTLSCSMEKEEMVRFEVHNPGEIPSDVRLQIFQRSFSTKGRGRGLGTYSIRLLSEHYLKGRVGFITSESGGTIFYGIYPRTIISHPSPSEAPDRRTSHP